MTAPHVAGAETDPDWTPRQREVLGLLAHGHSNPEIATELGISFDGAKWHVREILQKLGVDSREDAAEYWRRRNGLRPRLWRVARGLFALPAWTKWLVGGSAIAATTVAAVVLAWPGAATAPESPPASASPTATVTAARLAEAPFPGLYPQGTTTGIADVDAAIGGVTSGDPGRVFALAQYYFTPCVAQVDYGDSDQLSSVCAPDMAAATVLSGYFSGPCGAGWVDRDHFNIEGGLPVQMTASDPYLFAVLRAHATPAFAVNEAYAATQYIAIFQPPGYSQSGGIAGARAIGIGAAGITLMSPACASDARDLLGHLTGFEMDGFVLAPKAGAIHEAMPATYGSGVATGVPSVDRAVNAILAGDALTDDMFHWTAAPCSANPPGIGDTPLCPDGVADGTPIGRILVGGCEPGALSQGDGTAAWVPRSAGLRLYAITRTAPDDELDGKYVAIFVDSAGFAFRPSYVGIDDQGIVSMFTGACRSNAVAWAAQQPGFLLAPRAS